MLEITKWVKRHAMKLSVVFFLSMLAFTNLEPYEPAIGNKENRGPRKSFLLTWDATVGGTKPEGQQPFSTSTDDTTGNVTGTGSDTSKVFFSEDFTMLQFNAQDPAAGEDSSDVTYTLYGASSNQYNRGKVPVWAKFSDIGTFNITYETARDTLWPVYDTLPYGGLEYMFLIVTGNADNSKATASNHFVTVSYVKK